MTYVDERSGKTYVTIQDKLEKCVNLIRDLSPTLPQLEEFRMNTMCLALYENDWYVASRKSYRILYLVPGRLKICSSNLCFVSGIERE